MQHCLHSPSGADGETEGMRRESTSDAAAEDGGEELGSSAAEVCPWQLSCDDLKRGGEEDTRKRWHQAATRIQGACISVLLQQALRVAC